MDQGYKKTKDGLHTWSHANEGLTLVIDPNKNTGTVYCEVENEGYTKPLTAEDVRLLIEFMRIPGTGLGMLLIKLGRAFGRAASGGSSAK